MPVDLAGPIVAALVLFAISTAIGTTQVVKLIRMHEARHELRHGSAGFIRSMTGWFVVVLWLVSVWFLSTILGDWHATGDLSGAIDRSWLRLHVILEILSVLAESN